MSNRREFLKLSAIGTASLAAPAAYSMSEEATANRGGGGESVDIQLHTPRTLHQRVGDVAVSTRAPMQRFLGKLGSYKFGAMEQVYRIYGFGSSVGAGAELPDPVTQSPVIVFSQYLNETLNRGGIYPLQVINRSVGGSVVADLVRDAWPSAISDNIYPDLALLCYGMNDFSTAMVNSGQTIAGFERYLRDSILTIQRAGGDVVLCTTPHPHTERFTYSLNPSVDMSWPVFKAKPVADEALYPPASASTTTILLGGVSVPADVRFLHGNEIMRRIAAELGCALVDVERYWFEAVAEHGQDALYASDSFNHPNLLGHQLSYWKAFEQFCGGLVTGSIGVSAPPLVFRGLAVRGDSVYDTPQEAQLDVTASPVFGAAEITRDEYGRQVHVRSRSGAEQMQSFTDVPGGAVYGAVATRRVERTKGLFMAGEYVDISVPKEGAARLFVTAWMPGQPTWGHAENIVAVNPDGVTTTINQQAANSTGGTYQLFSVTSTPGGVRVTATYDNTTLLYVAEGLKYFV